MAKNRKKNGKGNGKFPGRPKMCEKPPNEGACLKQLRSPRPRICMTCEARETLKERKKIFGDKAK